MERIILREGWYTSEVGEGIDLNASGVYEWRIEGIGVYVGKAKTLSKPLKSYPANLRNMIEGRPWHGDLSKDFRGIHYALKRAYEEERAVTFRVLEICSVEDGTERKAARLRDRRREEAEGGLPVLND